MPQEVNIGLSGNQIMQKFLVRRIHGERELRFTETNDHSVVGFVTGFDDVCIQISTTPIQPGDEPRGMLLFWPLKSIEETGNKLDSLDVEHRQRIRSFTSVLRDQCETIVRSNGNSDNRSRARAR